MPPQKTFCGPECVHEWKLRSDVAYLRSQLFLRDKGVCKDCGLDTLRLRRQMYDMTESARERAGAERGFPAYQSRNLMLWEADHVVPVSQGGGLIGLDGFQSLCVPCHQRKSLRERL
jgi:5-methylcytosine-specific restriction protein A